MRLLIYIPAFLFTIHVNAQKVIHLQSEKHFPFISKSEGLTNEVINAYNKSQQQFSIKISMLPYKRALTNMKDVKSIVATLSKSIDITKDYIHLPLVKLPMVILENVKSTAEDKKVKTVGLIRGEENLELNALKQVVGSNIKTEYVPNYLSLFTMLSLDRIDYAYCGLVMYEEFKNKKPTLMNAITIIDETYILFAGLTFKKSFDKPFVKSFSLFMKEYVKSKVYEKMSEKYFKKDYKKYLIKSWKPITL